MLWFTIGSVLSALASYIGIAALAAWRFTTPRRRTPSPDPATAGLRFEDTWFSARGEPVTIAAWHLPAPQATRAIIIAHGVGGCRGKEFTVGSHQLLEHLVECGFTVLVLDLRGHGASSPAPMTYGLSERHDVLGAVDWLMKRGYAPSAIGVLGIGMGGVAAIGAAHAEPAIGALVLDSAYADFSVMIWRHFQAYSRLPRAFLPAALILGRVFTGAWLARLHPAALLQALGPRPAMIIHARGDGVVPIADAQALAHASGGLLWLTDGSSHLGSFAADPQAYCQRIEQFFSAALAEPETMILNLNQGTAWHRGQSGALACMPRYFTKECVYESNHD